LGGGKSDFFLQFLCYYPCDFTLEATLAFFSGYPGMLLEMAILFRAACRKILSKYPLFYTYIGVVLLIDCSRYFVYMFDVPHWAVFYWYTQFFSVLVGYGVILEILKQSLDSFPGAERFGQYLVLGVFAAVFAFVALRSATRSNWSPAATSAEFERDLRAVQVLVLMSILAVVFYYRIAVGRNVKGMILGYGLFIGTSVMNFAVRSYAGDRFNAWWMVFQQYSYAISLIIWAVALWSYAPNPIPKVPPGVESDYETLALRTRAMVAAMRSHLGRAARS
jgi:hypothetical protein